MAWRRCDAVMCAKRTIRLGSSSKVVSAYLCRTASFEAERLKPLATYQRRHSNGCIRLLSYAEKMTYDSLWLQTLGDFIAGLHDVPAAIQPAKFSSLLCLKVHESATETIFSDYVFGEPVL
eukprot:gnl/TRDRNA2_/TRDRNA2_86922_c0_seq2.p1 gnl/TRDRNA2_/TRDRNA2_86922_c0~~gnl/TRDRNA2_/TRDRNA2_86922_c0_seq2.p1  ORF type:complete len:121 (+),score=7.40 gnl/TRDRNA2_/TRDRNA2_86922_c0_seq2:195-557(+)